MLEKYTLSNGIPLFIAEVHHAPVVSIQAWVSRGSAHEPANLAGISHFIEHALFKGTRRRQVGQIASEIESWGGEINAFTSFDETVYYCTLASRYFENGLDVITDAIQNPTFDKHEMDREREVILEEIKRAHDSPQKIVFTNLWSTAFSGSAYGRPVLGFEKTVAKLDAKTLKKYFSENYHAGTISLFIAGDISASNGLRLAQQKLSRIKQKTRNRPRSPKPRRLPTLPFLSAGRDIQECHIQIGFPTASIQDSSIPSLDLLCSAMGQGESSRLYQTLVKKEQVALDVEMGLVATDACGMATLGILSAPENLQKALQKASEVLQTAATEGLTEQELERVQSAMEAEVVYGKETVEGYAKRLGYYYRHFGDPQYERTYLEATKEVTPMHTQEALKNLVSKKPIASLVHPNEFKVDKKSIYKSFTAPKVKKQLSQKVHALEKLQRKNVRFVTKKNTALPVTSVRFIFVGGGACQEAPEQYGISNLFRSLWTSGTPTYNSLEIAKTLESVGASLHAFAGKHTSGISLDFLTRHWGRIRPILEEILLSPTFPESELATEQNLVQREILSQFDSPAALCQMNFLKSLYENHPYGRSHLGTEATVRNCTSEKLKAWYQDHIHQNQLVISTVGDFEVNAWADELAQIVHRLPEKGEQKSADNQLNPIQNLQIQSAQKQPLHQAHIMLGFRGASLHEPERYALRLLSSCLAGQGGRLFLELRDRQSLAYTVAPLISDSLESGIFAFYIGCSPEKWEKAIRGLRGEIDKVLNRPLKAKELSRAKKYLIGRFELDMQRRSSQTLLFGLDEVYGLGHEHSLQYAERILALKAQDIQEAAQKYFQTDRAVLSVVHPDLLEQDKIQMAWNNLKSNTRPKSKKPKAADNASVELSA